MIPAAPQSSGSATKRHLRELRPRTPRQKESTRGSGTTLEACLREGFDVVAIEREASYLPLIDKLIRKGHAQGLDFDWGDE